MGGESSRAARQGQCPELDMSIFTMSFSVPVGSEGATSGLQMEGGGE